MISKTMPQSTPSSLGPCEVRASGLHWERIQLVVRLAGVPDASQSNLEAGDVCLRPSSGKRPPLAAMPAYRGELGPGERLVRFNVFAGPDQAALEPGLWTLSIRRGADAWCTVAAAPTLTDPQAASHDFTYSGGVYRVEVQAEHHAVELRISVRAAAGARARVASLRGLRDRVSRARRSAFGALATVLRRVIPHRRRRVVFTSDSRTALGGNLKIVHDRMIERGLNHQLQLLTIFKPSVRARRGIRDRARLVWLLASADVILLDDYQPAIYQLGSRPDARIIQLWHAWGAFKTVGYSRIGKPGGPSPFSSVHRNYTYAIASSRFEVPFYAEAFGLPEERVIPTGVPRMDHFLDPVRQATGREMAFRSFPEAREREVILFAPTFRGAGALQADYAMEMIDFEALHALSVERNAVTIFKMHPFVDRTLQIPREYGDRLLDASRSSVEVNDLLLISNLLITDYSSLIFEFSTLGRPMLFFAYDLEEYIATRDFYEPFEEFVPGRIAGTFPELLDAIRRDDYQVEKVAPFATRHLPTGQGTATDRIIDELVLPT